MAGLTQEQAFEIVKKERQYQDKNFNPDDIKLSGLTRAQRDAEVLSHLALIEGYAQDAFRCWTFNRPTTNAIESNRDHPAETGDIAALQQVAKIAAIAVRALERIGFADQLLEKGLR